MAEKTIKTKKVMKDTVKPAVKENVAEKVEGTVKASAKPAVKKATTVKAVVKPVAKKVTETKQVDFSVAVYDLDGKQAGTVTLPKELFGQKVNKQLLAQAVRVYLANKRQGNASTKTRGEVDGSTAKIYKQKGTGRARHGSKRAPIFVKGGIVFGPRPRDFGLTLPQKMRQKALFSALSAKVGDGLKVITGLEQLEPKTKAFAAVLEKLGVAKNTLVILSEDKDNVKRAARNIQGVITTAAVRLNAYAVLRAKHVLLAQDAVEVLEKHFVTKK